MAAAKKTAAKKAATKTTTAKAAPAPAPQPAHAPAAPVATSAGVGFFGVPTVERSPWGILCLILNIVPVPGVGTIIAGVKASATNQIVKGAVQILTTFILVGAVWSIIDGIRIFMRSR